MQYKPMTDDEIENENLIPDGEKCSATVVSSELYIGKQSGKESTKVILSVSYGMVTVEIWCFLTPAYKKLWKHAVIAMLGEQAYNSGDISPVMFEGKRCIVQVGLEQYNGKNKNSILDFFAGENEQPKAVTPKPELGPNGKPLPF